MLRDKWEEVSGTVDNYFVQQLQLPSKKNSELSQIKKRNFEQCLGLSKKDFVGQV